VIIVDDTIVREKCDIQREWYDCGFMILKSFMFDILCICRRKGHRVVLHDSDLLKGFMFWCINCGARKSFGYQIVEKSWRLSIFEWKKIYMNSEDIKILASYLKENSGARLMWDNEQNKIKKG
jgi:hypothetical protein